MTSSSPEPPPIDKVHLYQAELDLVDDEGVPFCAKWQWEPTRPTRRPAGVTGWASYQGQTIRLHVCANNPCTARHEPSKYGEMPVPKHGRLRSTTVVVSPVKEPPAPVGVQPASAEVHQLPAPAGVCPSTTTVVVSPVEEPPAPVGVQPASAEVQAPAPAPNEQIPAPAEELPVAQAPAPSDQAPAPADLPPPPQGAALCKGFAAAPLPATQVADICTTLVPAKIPKPQPPLEETEDVVICGEVLSESLAAQMKGFVVELQTPCKPIGVSAFLLFALAKRVRVHVWYGKNCVDVLSKYAPWLSDSISNKAPVEAIACRYDGKNGYGTLHFVEEDVKRVNHWVGCIPLGASGVTDDHGDGAADDDDTNTFQAIYLSLGRIVIPTVADGDCGLDVQCLMLGAMRHKALRDSLRCELAAFALAHMGNRALIASLYRLVEVKEHLGLYELAAAGEQLLMDDVPSDNVPRGNERNDVRTFSDDQISAAKWKCGLHKASSEAIVDVLRALPDSIIEATVNEFKNRSAPGPSSPQRPAILLSRDALLKTKLKAGEAFFQFIQEREGGELPYATLERLKQGKTPYGAFPAFTEKYPELKRCAAARGQSLLRMYQRAVSLYLSPQHTVVTVDSPSEDKEPPENPNACFTPHTQRTGQQYYSSRLRFTRDDKRRRSLGGGRHRSAAILRELLMEWYGVIRHSVDCKIMVRFPKQVLLVKAQMLQQEYCAQCLLIGIAPEKVDVTGRWLNELLDEYRVSDRKPNRKFKVPRSVLKERLEIWWVVVARLRILVFLHFGYEPVAKNIDQSPFHGNEAGSQACNTLALKGAPTVPLLENHAATRERWSLNSITDSSLERIQQRLPGFEIMFKADGKQLEARLKAYVVQKGVPFRCTVVTGPSGSYKEGDILNFLEEHLDAWGPNRRWEFVFLDAYAPGLTDNVQRLCWTRGYILVTHGGGASMVAQTNDTDHHQHVRKRFIDKQTALVISKARRAGGGLVDLTKEENIDIMIEVMSDPELHLRASRGYKYTGTMVALDGSEDKLICREAKDFWIESKMRQKIDSAVADVKEKYHAGLLPWNYATVQSLITPYPRKGCLDVLRPGQEDESTPDPDGLPWEVEAPKMDDSTDGMQEEANSESDASGDDQILEYDPEDWARPSADDVGGADVADGKAQANSVEQCDVVRHGDGLTADQAEVALEYSGRVQQLQQAKDILKGMNSVVGASLALSVDRAIKSESKKYHQRTQGDVAVDKAMRSSFEAEQASCRRQRAEFQEHMQQVKEKKRLEVELKSATDELKNIRKASRDACAVVTARETIKTFSLLSLGKGKKNGGGAQCQKLRFEVLERVRAIAPLSAEQSNDWENFKLSWDKEMASTHGENWADLFAEWTNHVLEELAAGNTHAFSHFMFRESKRVLADHPVLVVPGS